MRKEAVVVAARTQGARCYVSNTGSASVLGDQRSKVDMFGFAGIAPCELPNYVSPDLVALPAYGGAEVKAELRDGDATMG